MPTTFRIQRSQIIGTTTWVFDVYEPYAGHSTFSHFDGVRWGRVGTRPLTPELDAIPPMSDARIAAVQAFHTAQYDEAYDAIVAKFPEAWEGTRSMGSIDLFTVKTFPRQTERILEVA